LRPGQVNPRTNERIPSYPTPCLPLAGFESINAGNNGGGFFDVA